MLGIHPDNTRRYRTLVLSLFGALIVLNLADLISTAVALGINGLSEGNAAILAIADTLGTSTVWALVLTKVIIISATGLVVLFGIRTPNLTIRLRVAVLLIFLTALLGFVAVNNVYMIGFCA